MRLCAYTLLLSLRKTHLYIMAKVIKTPSVVKAAGNKHKVIEEFFGRVNTKSENISIARMKSPVGWEEPGQRPDFDEYTLVVRGNLQVETEKETFFIQAGQAILIEKGEWVRYSTPWEGGAEYVAICLPAFSPDNVNREE